MTRYDSGKRRRANRFTNKKNKVHEGVSEIPPEQQDLRKTKIVSESKNIHNNLIKS